ncbi:MAG: hypothetical protein M3Q87_06760, partial [Actinomycetota bacterium]|nr:hypothetical protein [Actinomycetota bacterium]
MTGRYLAGVAGALAALLLPVGAGSLVAPAYADDDPIIPSRTQLRDARAQVTSTGAAVTEIRARLTAARQQLSDQMILAAQAAEAYNGARYRLQQARQMVTVARQRAQSAAAEVEAQWADLESFAVGSASDTTHWDRLGTVLSAGGPQQLLAEAGAWSSTSSALLADLDTWDAARAGAEVLRDSAYAAVADRRAAAAEAEAARRAAAQAVKSAETQQLALEAETDQLISELARVQGVSVQLARQRELGIAERADDRAADRAAERRAARQQSAA